MILIKATKPWLRLIFENFDCEKMCEAAAFAVTGQKYVAVVGQEFETICVYISIHVLLC